MLKAGITYVAAGPENNSAAKIDALSKKLDDDMRKEDEATTRLPAARGGAKPKASSKTKKLKQTSKIAFILKN